MLWTSYKSQLQTKNAKFTQNYLALTQLSRRPALTRFISSGIGAGSNLPFTELDGDSSGEMLRATFTSLFKSPCRLDLCSAATCFGSKRKYWRKFVTSPWAIAVVLLDMFGSEDKIGFSMLSRKLPGLSNEAAMWDPRCPLVYNGLSGLPEESSNLLEVAIASVSTHSPCHEASKYRGAWQRWGTTAHKDQLLRTMTGQCTWNRSKSWEETNKPNPKSFLNNNNNQ